MRAVSLKSSLLWIVVGIIVILISVPFYAFVARANVYNLYAKTCLGGWGNTHLAAGPPEASEQSGVQVFTESNSARLNADVHAQIYCGGFTGDILKSTVPKKILVKFSWAVEYPDLRSLETPDINTESATSTEGVVQGANTESVSDQDDSLPEESIVEEESLPQEESPGTPETSETAPPESTETTTVEEAPLTEEPTEETTPTLEQTSDPAEPASEPTPELSSEEPVSFFNFLVPTAHAQEIKDEELGNVSTTPIDDMESEITTTTEAVSIAPNVSYGLVEVIYTLDGVEWKSLGFVEKDEFAGKQFEIPIEEASEWEDISKIQIGVQSVPVLDGIAPIIYLDSVWIETEYEYLQGDGDASQLAGAVAGLFGIGETSTTSPEVLDEVPEEILEEEALLEELPPGEPDVITMPDEFPPLPVSKRLYEKEIVIDTNATHRCEANPFSVDVLGRHSFSTKVAITQNPEQEYEAEIGSLPDGIDVRFTKSDDYIYRPDSDEDTLSLRIRNEEGSLTGNFSVPVIFTEKGKTDSSVVCQINVVNLE